MLNIIIVSDDASSDIGPNCALCYQHLSAEVDLINHNFQLITGAFCDAHNVQNAITSLNQERFVFVAYSHGKSNALVSAVAQDGYVSVANAYYFGSSLFYTNSCMTAVELKDALIASQCSGYVGYSGNVGLPFNEEDEEIFIACENSGIINFLNTDDSLTDSVEVMKQHYREQYDSLINQDMFVSASILLANLGYLTFHDDEQLTRSKLSVT